MKIQVLGPGCPICKKLYQLTQRAIKEAGLKEKVEYLAGQEGIQKIIKLGVMSSPVLVIDGEPVMVGFLEDVEKIKKLVLRAKDKAL